MEFPKRLRVHGIQAPSARYDRMGIYIHNGNYNDGRPVWNLVSRHSSLWYTSLKKHWIIGNTANIGSTDGSIYAAGSGRKLPCDPNLVWNRWNGRRWEKLRSIKVEDDCFEEEEEEEESNGEEEEEVVVEYTSVPPRGMNLDIDLKPLLFQSALSDVTFIVGEEKKEIYAHRILLAASSPIFSLMLYPNKLTVETKNSHGPPPRLVIKLPDVKPVIFKLLLEIIYTNDAPIDKETVKPCQLLAERYCVSKLLIRCGEILEQELTTNTVLRLFNTADLALENPDFGIDFINGNALELFKKFRTIGFLDLRTERVIHILQSDDLQCPEPEILTAVLEWGNLPGRRPNKLRAVLRHVRFPLFNFLDFYTLIDEKKITDLLNEEEILELLNYISCKEANIQPLPSTRWCTEARGSSKFSFKWKRCGKKGAISNDGRTCSGATSSFWGSAPYVCAVGNKDMAPNTGKYYWAIHIDSMNQGQYQCSLGVATKDAKLDSLVGQDKVSWGYINHGYKCHESALKGERYGNKFDINQVIGILYNSNEGTLTFYQNGYNHNVAFKNIRQTVYPAASINAKGSFTLEVNPDLPDDV